MSELLERLNYCRGYGNPLLKESGADHSDPANFRPISNLSTISEVLERLALVQLQPHLLSSVNFCLFQSGYRTGHSTETALLELLNDIYTAGDDQRCTVVIGLDISAVFDTISHKSGLHRRGDDCVGLITLIGLFYLLLSLFL